jgi:DNA-binding transcriptional MerR regulator
MKLTAIKEICQKHNITSFTINHYTNLGLLKVVAKKGNRRLYDSVEVERRLKVIPDLISQGYPLQLISKKLNNGE